MVHNNKHLFWNRLCFGLFFFCFFSFLPLHMQANELPAEIRIGLESKHKERSSVVIGNTSLKFGYEQNGVFQEYGFLQKSHQFVVLPDNGCYLRLENNFFGYGEALEATKPFLAQGFLAVPALRSDGLWQVYLGSFETPEQALSLQNLFGLPLTFVSASNQRVVLADETTPLVVFDGNSNPQFIDGANGLLVLQDRTYRGRLEISRFSGKLLTAVNVVSLNQYLYSAVPSEMPSSWHIEALKAQACAARNYAVTRLSNHKESGYHLCDTTHCQVYLGAGNEAASTTAAVDATSNMLIVYNGKPISAVFHSSSGGATENSENVWTQSEPYMRSVKELNETTHKVWERQFSLQQMTELLIKNNINIGAAKSVRIERTEPTGRVQEFVIVGENGTKSLTKEAIRTFFATAPGGALESRLFTLNGQSTTTSDNLLVVSNGLSKLHSVFSSLRIKTTDGTKPLGNQVFAISATGLQIIPSQLVTTNNTSTNSHIITISGRGYGHGVGMSQHGAKGMAEMGYTYEQILKWYYVGAEVVFIAI